MNGIVAGSSDTWAVVLAAGDGRRLRTLTTTPAGIAIPKQYCSLQGGPSLLQRALARASQIVPLRRTCTVVAAQHRAWREPQLRHLLDHNIIEQPANRGTAIGLLLALLHILARDPQAQVVFLPADHYVADETTFGTALRRALESTIGTDLVCLLGIRPDEPDGELGYIVPADRGPLAASAVTEFVEKPSREQATTLQARGGLWNSFVFAGSARALLSFYGVRFAYTVAELRRAVAHARAAPDEGAAIAAVYRHLDSADFSRDVLQGQESRLRVITVPPCGWTDLGTPKRVARALDRMPHPTGASALVSNGALDLAAQAWACEFARGVAAASGQSIP